MWIEKLACINGFKIYSSGDRSISGQNILDKISDRQNISEKKVTI